MTALALSTDDRAMPSGVSGEDSPGESDVVSKLATVRPAITFKVYGVRVVRTETAVHMVCGHILRDPNRPSVCPCRKCRGEDQAYHRWPKC